MNSKRFYTTSCRMYTSYLQNEKSHNKAVNSRTDLIL